MIRITELKLPLSALPVEARRAADAPAETEADRAPVAHPVEALQALAAQALGIAHGDMVRLVTPGGAETAQATVSDGIMRGVVGVEHGFGHKALGAGDIVVDGERIVAL